MTNLKRPFDAAQTAQRSLSRIFNFERTHILKNTYAAIALALASLTAGQVMAADAGSVIDPATGIALRDLAPGRFEAKAAEQSKATSQAPKASTSRDAGAVVDPATGLTLRELSPGRYTQTAK